MLEHHEPDGRVQLPGQAQITKPFIPLGSVNMEHGKVSMWLCDSRHEAYAAEAYAAGGRKLPHAGLQLAWATWGVALAAKGS